MGKLRCLLWLPVFITLPAALLAEGRPSSSSRPGCHREGSAALTWSPCYLRSSFADGGGAMGSHRTKWFVPEPPPFLSPLSPFFLQWPVLELVPVTLKSAAPLPLSSAGGAGRSGEGRGVCPFIFLLVGLLFPCFCSSGGWCPPHASSGRRHAVVLPLLLVLRWMEPRREVEIFVSSSIQISSPGPWFGRRIFVFFSSLLVIMVMDNEQRRGRASTADRIRAHPRWILRIGYGAHCGDWPPAGTIDPPAFLAEGRPIIFLPAKMPDGRQPAFYSSSSAWCCGGYSAPSGSVPGGGVVVLERRQLGTRSRFFLALRGPFCLSQGLACSSYFLRVLAVRCCVLQVFK